MFKPVSAQVDIPDLERELLLWWQQHNTIGKYLRRNRDASKQFSFLDGPITANNPMGVHHAWGRTYKDLYQRYKTMQGFQQRYQNGFDCQGLWVEVEVERELGFNSKRDIEEYGIAAFVEKCKERVRRYAEVQTQQSLRLGYWMEWDNSYYTMSEENNYSIWHFLKKCHQRGWIYQGRDGMPWCIRCGTVLSQHEIATEGYQEIAHKSIYLKLPLLDSPNECLLVWTTTPWTLTSNTAVAVHPDLSYLRVCQDGQHYYVGKGAAAASLRGQYQVVAELSGRELVGRAYRGPYDELPAQRGIVHRVVPWRGVSEAEGTGLVHIAPGCGHEDYLLGQEQGLAVLAPLDEAGNFIEGFGWLTGKKVAELAEPILHDMEAKGISYHTHDYTHRYPVCWRCGSELVFRLVDEWFISMDELRYQIMEVARKIRWIPEFGLERELDWLRHMEDWCISKKRYWGLALPIYQCSCGHFDVVGSLQELKERAVEGWAEFEGHTPHRPWVDAVKVRCCHCGQAVPRIPDVGNPWLDAGIVPFSTLHYTDDRAYWERWFPADFITECFPGQFRNWFYSLLAMSTVLEDRPPFRTVLGHALVRDEHGEEMHKSKGNAIWFDDAAEKMGADVMRWLFVSQNPTVNLNFGYGPGEDAKSCLLRPLWNVYSFFVTYANIDRFDPLAHSLPVAERAALDRWLLSKLNLLVQTVQERLDDYDAATPARAIEAFVDDLSNWYVRRGRRRYWKSEEDKDKVAAYLTLYEALVTLSKLLAPFIPFVAEELYRNLVGSVDAAAPESVHLCHFPGADMALVDEPLVESMALVQKIVYLGRAARSKARLKVRQPLEKVLVWVKEPAQRQLPPALASQVTEELNVKEMSFVSDEMELLEYSVRPRPELLGPKYGRGLAELAARLRQMDQAHLARQIASGREIEVDHYRLLPVELEVTTSDRRGYAVAQEPGHVVGVATALTPELVREGLARELVHRIQTMRKEADFRIQDRIVTYYQAGPTLGATITTHANYIQQETLSRELHPEVAPPDSFIQTIEIDGEAIILGLKRVSELDNPS